MKVNDDGELKVDPADVKPLIRLHELVNSISLTSRWLLCTSSSLKYRSTVRLSCLSYSGPWLFFAFPTIKNIWTSSASSTPSHSPSFLLGTCSSAIHLVAHPHTTQQTSYPVKSDVFATCFLPHSSSDFLVGSRDRDMRLFDVRTPLQQKGEIVIRHGVAVSHICALSSASVIVDGPSRCAAYDLRYPHPRSPSASFEQATRAVRVYDRAVEEREFVICRGFDVDHTGEVMVREDSEGGFRMFSVVTGEELKKWKSTGEEPQRWKWNGLHTTLVFDRERRLWASVGKAMECFTY